jgi:hypothetical protein
VVPWCIAVEQDNPGFLQYFLLNENFKRVLDARWPPDYSISKISPWGYVAVSAVWCLPWMFLLPPTLKGAWEDWRHGFTAAATLQDRHRSDALTLLGVLAVLPIVMFLPLSSRLYYYSIPAIPPLAMMTGYWWSMAWQGKAERSRVWIGWIMTALGVALVTGLFWLPQEVIALFPELSQTQGVQTIVTVQIVGLSVGFMGSGAFLLRRQLAIALVLLWFGFGTTWACVIQGFRTVQDFRSSKTLVLESKTRLSAETLWIFEGSRELGTVGAMGFYLDPDGVAVEPFKLTKLLLYTATSKSTGESVLPINTSKGVVTVPIQQGRPAPDWIRSPTNTLYQALLVLTDGGANRLPPLFPGKQPTTLITKSQMNQHWQGRRPVVFVTDFLRRPEDSTDPSTLNLPKEVGKPLLEIGPRKLYGNAVAQKLWSK